MDKKNIQQNTSNLTSDKFPPVVSVLGHVDHGKTSLLDSIRKSNIASGEHGGITQRIGTSEILIDHEGKKRTITFIDTPGHEAFFTMRSQGVNASDIALLIVAADDGVKPQTKESIEKIKEAGLPFVVVITKIDLETVQMEKVKQMIIGEGILLEGLGGNTPYIGVSSKTGENIKELLDLILLVYDISHIEKHEFVPFMGVVIDSKLDKRRGAVSTVIAKQGKLSVGKKIYRDDKDLGKVRNLFDSNNKSIKEIGPGQGAEILGLSDVLPTGSIILDAPKTPEIKKDQELKPLSSFNLKDFFAEEKEEGLNIILKTETSGEADAIKSSLPELIKIKGEGQGEINVKDVLNAKDVKALLIGFNVGISKEAKALADTEKVFYKEYTIIYELLDELAEVLKTLGTEEEEVKIRGRADIIASFPTAVGKILGVKVTEGRLALNDPVIVTRADNEIGRAKITLLKRGKAEVKEVAKGLECGVTITPFVDFEVGDVLLSHSKN